MEDFIQLAWHVLTGPTSPRQSLAVWTSSTTTTEAIHREPQRVVTWATASRTTTDHNTAYPGGDASKQIMAGASQDDFNDSVVLGWGSFAAGENISGVFFAKMCLLIAFWHVHWSSFSATFLARCITFQASRRHAYKRIKRAC